MSILQSLSTLALRQLISGACTIIGSQLGTEVVDPVIAFLSERFTNHSQKLTRALQSANGHAWRALEVALAGDSWWEQVQVKIARAEDQAFRQQVQTFLSALPVAELAGKAQFRQQCLQELQAARKAGLLAQGSLDPHQLARQAGAFAQFGDPQKLVQAEWQTMERLAADLKRSSYHSLGWFLKQRPAEGMPLLVIAAGYFFRREVETDHELFQGLVWDKLEHLGQAQEDGFAALVLTLKQHGHQLESLLVDVHAVVVATGSDVREMRAQLHRQEQQLQQISQAAQRIAALELIVAQLPQQMQQLGQEVKNALEQHHLQDWALQPRDSTSLQNRSDQQHFKMLVTRFRSLPNQMQQQTPALMHAIAELAHLVGDFEAAQQAGDRPTSFAEILDRLRPLVGSSAPLPLSAPPATSKVTRCPHCRQSCQVPAETAGKQVRCPSCQHIFINSEPPQSSLPQPAKPAPPPVVHASNTPLPFPNGVLAGSTSEWQLAEKATANPTEAAALFESGEVAQWYKDNGWTYPVCGQTATGPGAVQQFLAALHLVSPPRVLLSEAPAAPIPQPPVIQTPPQRQRVAIERQMHRNPISVLGASATSYALVQLIPTGGGVASAALKLNIALVLDVSGSMYEEDGTGICRLKRIQDAAKNAMDKLKPEDTMSVVAFAHNAQVLLAPTPIAEKSKIDDIINKVDMFDVDPGGTAIHQGLELGFGELKEKAGPGKLSHIILFTDAVSGSEDVLGVCPGKKA